MKKKKKSEVLHQLQNVQVIKSALERMKQNEALYLIYYFNHIYTLPLEMILSVAYLILVR